MDLSFDKQFDYAGEIKMTPDSVDVAGPPSIVNSLTQIDTDPIQLNNVKEAIHEEVGLKKHKILSYSSATVKVDVPVEKFTEGNVSVRIQPLNVQSGYSLKTFPDRVQIRYLVALSKYNEVKEQMFDVVVNAEATVNSPPDKLKVEIVRYPTFIRSLTIDPEAVDYILRKQ